MMNLKESIKKIFFPITDNKHEFFLSGETTTSAPQPVENASENIKIFPSIDVNLEYVQVKYNTMINSDIVVREFNLTARNRQYKAFLLFIDGMVDTDLVNNYVLKPLMMKNQANSFEGNQNHIVSI